MKNWYENFTAQPHQPFFANGIIAFILFTGLIFAVYGGFLNINAGIFDFHAYIFIFVVFIQFFLGFLFVVFPRFLMQAVIEPRVYMAHFWGYFFVTYAFLISFLLGFGFDVLLVLNLLVQIFGFKLLFDIHKRSIIANKYDTKWVLIGFGCGLIFNAIFILSKFIPSLTNFAINGGFYLFLFIIVFAISQRMVPFFTSVKVQGYVIKRTENFMPILFGLLFLRVVVLSFFSAKFLLLTDIALFVLFVREFYIWRLPIFKTSAIMWVLYLSLYWIPVGFAISILEGINDIFSLGFVFEKTSLHTFAVGYFLTILIGFGTRVVLGHSGQTPHADAFTTAIFVFIQVVVFARLFAGFSLNFSLDYSFFINFSAVLMLIALLVWSARYLPILIKGFKPKP
ncbi:hypothetical protein CR66_08725 [Campylobacter mucosalis]|uniref:NnrS family protein n=1 Tax=Campylobacter mucosalis TaxID=202 RepID=UPI0004D738E7|nr:NnrS family protein [Campylobacter mucosalis]KEA45291.1 hypothetical protein CR66_08725 [Campylobacter mucosalis]QKF63694.1 putative heme-copper protein NnrS [Campylobacter mucosalis]